MTSTHGNGRLVSVLPWIALAAYLAFAYGAGSGSYIRILDVLDQHVAQLALLGSGPATFGDLNARVPEVLGGLPRSSLVPSETHAMLVAYRLLDPLTAYALNDVIVRVLALVGMTRLLRRHVIPSAPPALAHGVATAFALLPFFLSILWTLAAQPLLLSALLDLRSQQRTKSAWAVIALYPFGATLFVNAVSLLPALGLWVLWEATRDRRVAVRLFAALALLVALHSFVHHRQVLLALFPGDFVSHRIERVPPVMSAWYSFKHAVRNLLFGQTHAESAHTIGALGAGAAAVVLMVRTRTTDTRVVAVLVGCAALSALYGGVTWLRGVIGPPADSPLGVILSLDASRVHFLHPLAWSLLLALAGAFLLERMGPGRRATTLVGALVLAQVATAVALSDPVRELQRDEPISYAAFRAEALFDDIRESIRSETGLGPEDYRVASLGMLPAHALLNGFRMADGYVNSYPIEKKHAMERVNRAELAKADKRTRWFATSFGSRCYLISAELGWRFMHTRADAVRVENLETDTAALRAMGARFVFSAVEVAEPERLGWRVLGTFERPDAPRRIPWRITVYDLN